MESKGKAFGKLANAIDALKKEAPKTKITIYASNNVICSAGPVDAVSVLDGNDIIKIEEGNGITYLAVQNVERIKIEADKKDVKTVREFSKRFFG